MLLAFGTTHKYYYNMSELTWPVVPCSALASYSGLSFSSFDENWLVGIGWLLLVPNYPILNQVYGFSTCRSWIKNFFTKAAFLQLITGMPLRKPTPERGAGKRILNSLQHLRKKRRHARYLMQVIKMQFDICCGLYSSSFGKLCQVWEWNGSLRSWKDCYS